MADNATTAICKGILNRIAADYDLLERFADTEAEPSIMLRVAADYDRLFPQAPVDLSE